MMLGWGSGDTIRVARVPYSTRGQPPCLHSATGLHATARPWLVLKLPPRRRAAGDIMRCTFGEPPRLGLTGPFAISEIQLLVATLRDDSRQERSPDHQSVPNESVGRCRGPPEFHEGRAHPRPARVHGRGPRVRAHRAALRRLDVRRVPPRSVAPGAGLSLGRGLRVT